MNITDKIDWKDYDLYVHRRRNLTLSDFRTYLKSKGITIIQKQCIYCGKELKERQIYYCSLECQTEFSALCSWNFTRYIVRQKAKNICQKCGKITIYGHVHHIKSISEGGSVFNPKNLIYLCKECHVDIHSSNFYDFNVLKSLRWFFKRNFINDIQIDPNQKTLREWIEANKNYQEKKEF